MLIDSKRETKRQRQRDVYKQGERKRERDGSINVFLKITKLLKELFAFIRFVFYLKQTLCKNSLVINYGLHFKFSSPFI